MSVVRRILVRVVKDKITLIGYALLNNIGEILRTPTQNLLYIWEG